jgi:hypothetical protein
MDGVEATLCLPNLTKFCSIFYIFCPKCNILLTVHRVMILGKWPTCRTVLYYVFILTLYMLRAHCAHHQERQIVSVQPLVSVTLSCASRSLLPTCTRHEDVEESGFGWILNTNPGVIGTLCKTQTRHSYEKVSRMISELGTSRIWSINSNNFTLK